jgi:hypothetical protein
MINYSFFITFWHLKCRESKAQLDREIGNISEAISVEKHKNLCENISKKPFIAE